MDRSPALSAEESAPVVPLDTLDNQSKPAVTGNEDTAFRVLMAVGLAHCLNDATQSLLMPTYPLMKASFDLSFSQIGRITLAYQLTASMLQPLVGY